MARALAILLALAAAANAAATYFAPAYGQALADSPTGPITEPLLRASGLTAGAVTPFDQSVTSAGHTIRLVGAYSDGLQTTVFLQVDGQPLAAPRSPGGKVWGDRYGAEMRLTDQFGRQYAPYGTSGTSVSVYEPLSGPAAVVGARLTLHLSRLYDMSRRNTAAGPEERPPSVDGDWTFRFVLVQRPAHALPLPAPIHIGDTTYTFTSVRAAATLSVRIRVSGGAVSRWNQPGPGGGVRGDEAGAYLVELYDRTGRPQREGFGGDSIDLSWILDGPGRYRLHVGGTQGVDVWFDVPKS